MTFPILLSCLSPPRFSKDTAKLLVFFQNPADAESNSSIKIIVKDGVKLTLR
jgi:hypothetical protein